MTQEEERTSTVFREKIRVVKAPPPDKNLEARIDRLAELARAGDRTALLEVLRQIVPSYTPAVATDSAARPPVPVSG
jgi:hypothetical protein